MTSSVQTTKIEFSTSNVRSFTAWLKKFESFNNSLLLEVDLISNFFIAKSYDVDHSAVKQSKISFDDAGFDAIVPDKKMTNRIKVGVLNISKLIKTFDQFNDNSFNFILNYGDLITNNVTELVGTTLIIKNESLKVNLDCASLSIFKYISDEVFTNNIASIDDTLVEFTLLKSAINKIYSLSDLDKDYKYLQIRTEDNEVYVSSNTFDLLIEKSAIKTLNNKLSIFKKQFDNIDVEDYKITMCENKLVFSSTETNTICVISKIQTTE